MNDQNAKWISVSLLVIGALSSAISIATLLIKDPIVTWAFVAGGGWMISIPLIVITHSLERSNASLKLERDTIVDSMKTEIADMKGQMSEWRVIATRDSETLNVIVARGSSPDNRITPRQRKNSGGA